MAPGSNETAIKDLTAMFASIAHDPVTVALCATEDQDDHSSQSSSCRSNGDVPDLYPLEVDLDQPGNPAVSRGYFASSIDTLMGYFNAPMEPVRLADGRLIYAKIVGYAQGDFPLPPPPMIKISKTKLRVCL
jgi:hypothetical protein